MFIQASKILKMPVGIIETRSKVGEVEQILVDLKNGEIIGFLIKIGGFFNQHKVLSVKDILDFDRNAIVIKKIDDLLEINEIVRAKKIISDNDFIIGMQAFTESNQYLGRVFDFVFNIDDLQITKFYIHQWFNEKILPIDKVIKIDNHKIIFSDDIIKPRKLKKNNIFEKINPLQGEKAPS